jgi:hypothetical protein
MAGIDAHLGPESTLTFAGTRTFTGTWGPSPTDRTSGGTWKAKATCKQKS